jgi:hypothetical protein
MDSGWLGLSAICPACDPEVCISCKITQFAVYTGSHLHGTGVIMHPFAMSSQLLFLSKKNQIKIDLSPKCDQSRPPITF